MFTVPRNFPVSIGTETFGSLMLPPGRAALFSLKLSRGFVFTGGVVPISRFSGAPGPMTKSTKDLALLMDVLVDASKTRLPGGCYVSRATGSWEGLRIGTLDPEMDLRHPFQENPRAGYGRATGEAASFALLDSHAARYLELSDIV